MSLYRKLSRTRSWAGAQWREFRRRHPVMDAAIHDWRRYGRTTLSLFLKCPGVVFVPIVGMHRSGTSCITSILARNGLHLSSDLLEANGINPEGFWESNEVIRINDLALGRFTYDYTNPAGVVTRFPRTLLRRAERYLLALASEPVVGWKDPRMTITWPAWHELLYKNRHVVVACFRHPRNVANSFTAADRNLPYEIALDCWRKYNSMVSSIVADIVFINFDEPLEPQIEYACSRVGLPFSRESMAVYKPKLVHNDQRDVKSGSDEADSLYDHLLARWRAQPTAFASERVELAHGVLE